MLRVLNIWSKALIGVGTALFLLLNPAHKLITLWHSVNPRSRYDQLEKLKPFVGDLLHQPTDFSYLMATWRMYFPFLTCEVKCGAAALDIADRQNSHSMTHAVRAVVQLYKYAKWEEGFDWKKEVHREILAFSISHDDKAVRIYGYYPVLEDDRTTFYRHPIRDFSLTDLDGRDKWTAYKFTKNVYEIWMPKHL